MNCGIMPNYQCTAACKHCLYACDPQWGDGYMTTEMMRYVCKTLKESGCRSVHIGGGEPFIDFDGLCELVRTCKTFGIKVDYIETNAFWVNDEEKTIRRLQTLSQTGVDALCISHDAYHAEYVDATLPLKLAKICRHIGYGYFMWETQINRLRFNGRAIQLEKEHFQNKPLKDILLEARSRKGCKGLTSGNHFHVDINGMYIPPGCTGIVLPLKEVLSNQFSKNYPVFNALYNGGPAALIELAQERGFELDPTGYPSVCACCFFVRKYLSESGGFAELDREHYVHALM